MCINRNILAPTGKFLEYPAELQSEEVHNKIVKNMQCRNISISTDKYSEDKCKRTNSHIFASFSLT